MSTVVGFMNYAFLTITSEEEGRQIVQAPRRTDVIGHALRGAFDGTSGLPADMAAMLRRLDAMPRRTN